MAKDQAKGRMLDVFVIASEFFAGHSHLHWGYWDDPTAALQDLDTKNYYLGQQLYIEKIADAIPDGTKTILDVGSGSGEIASHLQKKGYEVECVCPSIIQNKFNAEKTEPGTVIHEGYFQDIVFDKVYDCVIFPESFQYVPIEKTFAILKKISRYVVICDYYKKSPDAKQGGGFSYSLFQEQISVNDFNLVHHEDITDGVSPNYAFKRKLYNDLVIPTLEIISERVRQDYPFLSKIFLPILRRDLFKIDKYRRKAELSDPANLAKWIEYGIWVLKNNA